MLASAEPRARFMLVCSWFRRAARNAAKPSGSKTRAAITTPTTPWGSSLTDHTLKHRRESLGEGDDGDQRDEQQAEADERRPAGGRRSMGFVVAHVRWQEVVAVAQ